MKTSKSSPRATPSSPTSSSAAVATSSTTRNPTAPAIACTRLLRGLTAPWSSATASAAKAATSMPAAPWSSTPQATSCASSPISRPTARASTSSCSPPTTTRNPSLSNWCTKLSLWASANISTKTDSNGPSSVSRVASTPPWFAPLPPKPSVPRTSTAY